LNLKSLLIWTDGGPYFRNFEMVNYYRSLLENKKFSSIDFNYFIEYHGKNMCDSHFSHISRVISTYETSVDQISSTDDLIKILTDSFNQYDRNRTKKPKFNSEIFFLELRPIIRNAKISQCKITNFKCYYSFTFVNLHTVFACVNSNNMHGNLIKLELISKTKKIKIKLASNVFDNRKLTFSNTLWKKEEQISQIQKQRLPEIRSLFTEEIICSSNNTTIVVSN